MTLWHMLLWVASMFLIVLLGMGGVAFITLLERKILGFSQIRIGPNKVTFVGLLQPVADGIKLLFKEILPSGLSTMFMYLLSPLLLLGVFMLLWITIIPWAGAMASQKMSLLLLFSFLAVGSYAVILTGWSIMSSFSKLGSLRGILQSLSYEVALVLVLLIFAVLLCNLSMSITYVFESEILLLWSIVWLMLSMMETNRAPFDLLEGESELISGFNIEMGSLLFVFLFLSEYGMIIFLSCVLSLAVLAEVGVLALFGAAFILLSRSVFPRVRYDNLMGLMWYAMLPLSIIFFSLLYL